MDVTKTFTVYEWPAFTEAARMAAGPGTKRDRLEAAWLLTIVGQHTIPHIAKASGVAERTVGNMRATLATNPSTATLTWREVKEAR